MGEASLVAEDTGAPPMEFERRWRHLLPPRRWAAVADAPYEDRRRVRGPRAHPWSGQSVSNCKRSWGEAPMANKKVGEASLASVDARVLRRVRKKMVTPVTA